MLDNTLIKLKDNALKNPCLESFEKVADHIRGKGQASTRFSGRSVGSACLSAADHLNEAYPDVRMSVTNIHNWCRVIIKVKRP